MAISIKDPETDRIARELSALTGESLTEAIRVALEERLARHQRPQRQYPMLTAARRLQERLAAMPVVNPSAPLEVTYDDYGLPNGSCPAIAVCRARLLSDGCGGPGVRAVTATRTPMPSTSKASARAASG